PSRLLWKAILPVRPSVADRPNWSPSVLGARDRSAFWQVVRRAPRTRRRRRREIVVPCDNVARSGWRTCPHLGERKKKVAERVSCSPGFAIGPLEAWAIPTTARPGVHSI